MNKYKKKKTIPVEINKKYITVVDPIFHHTIHVLLNFKADDYVKWLNRKKAPEIWLNRKKASEIEKKNFDDMVRIEILGRNQQIR